MADPIRVSIEGVEDVEARRMAMERAREAAILELYRIGQITSGRAAHDLGIGRIDFLAPDHVLIPNTVADEVVRHAGVALDAHFALGWLERVTAGVVRVVDEI